MAPQPVQRVFMVTKNHLDLGFTESAAKVTHDAINWMLPVAVNQARQMRESGGMERFCWTVPSFILWEALEHSTGITPAELEAAIALDEVAWHALPFTTHTELMDEELFEFGLSISATLDRRFGKKTIAAKMTDVPGHTRAAIPFLADAGVRLLHVGVNYMSMKPDVPPYFRWRHESGKEVVVFYAPNYGGQHQLPGAGELLSFCMVGDNMEVPSIPDVREYHADLRRRYPEAEVAYRTLSDYARTIEPFVQYLPVVTAEIGDTWIHGVGTDPWKTARYRALLRLRKEWLRSRKLLKASPTYVAFSRHLLCVPEHTWGVAITGHLRDVTNHANPDFHRVRHRGNYKTCEASWQEQRDYLELAVEALQPEPALQNAARAALQDCTPVQPNLDGFTPCDPAAEQKTAHFKLALDPATGAVSALQFRNRPLVAPGQALGLFRYQTFSLADFQRFARQYCRTGLEKVADFGKPGLKPEQAESRWFLPRVLRSWRRQTATGLTVVSELSFVPEASERYGASRKVFLTLHLPADQPTLAFELTWFEKPPTRLPEAFWLSFAPAVTEPANWRLHKFSDRISPLEVVSNGNRALHAVGLGASYRAEGLQLTLETFDAPLLCPGAPSLTDFNNAQPDLAQGLHLNLLNNIWGTNFPAWYGDDARFRVNFCVS